MNSIDLETKIEGLKKAIAEHKDFAGNYESDLARTEQELKDLGKIALPPVVFDDIYEAVEDAVSQYDFSDTENFEIEYGIDYDGKVNCESHEFNNNQDLLEMINDKIQALFKESVIHADGEDEFDRTENDNHPVDKLQG